MLTQGAIGWWNAWCIKCGARTLTRLCEKDAVADWNKRVSNADEVETKLKVNSAMVRCARSALRRGRIYLLFILKMVQRRQFVKRCTRRE